MWGFQAWVFSATPTTRNTRHPRSDLSTVPSTVPECPTPKPSQPRGYQSALQHRSRNATQALGRAWVPSHCVGCFRASMPCAYFCVACSSKYVVWTAKDGTFTRQAPMPAEMLDAGAPLDTRNVRHGSFALVSGAVGDGRANSGAVSDGRAKTTVWSPNASSQPHNQRQAERQSTTLPGHCGRRKPSRHGVVVGSMAMTDFCFPF